MRDDSHYIRQMHGYASYLTHLAESGRLTRASLGGSVDMQLEVTMLLQIVGEAARRLRERGADLGPGIDLRAIAGMRNRISHDYDGVDWNLVELVVFEEIPMLVRDLEAVMAERGIEPRGIA